MTAKTKACRKATRQGRLRKAEQFVARATDMLALADDQQDVGDSFVTLCVTAGIAAADVICCARLGEHAVGEDHREAVALLKKSDGATATHLDVLLGMKTKAAYTSKAVSADDVKRAERAAAALVKAARQAHAQAG